MLSPNFSNLSKFCLEVGYFEAALCFDNGTKDDFSLMTENSAILDYQNMEIGEFYVVDRRILGLSNCDMFGQVRSSAHYCNLLFIFLDGEQQQGIAFKAHKKRI